MIKAGTAFVDIDGDFTSLHKSLEGVLASITPKFGKLGAAGVAGIAVVSGAAVEAGKALYDIGEKFQDSYNTIRVGTGATGKTLDGLKDSFKAVVKDVPTDFKSAATAITEVNQRLGLTGKPLQEVSSQFLDLSRITKTDLSTNLTDVTKAFQRWGVSVSDQPGRLDELFRASQKTGTSVADLGTGLAKFGVPLKEFGFSFEQSTALLGSFNKAGINTNAAMAALKIGLANAAKAGEDPQQAFAKVTQEIKNAGSASEANAAAIKLFGTRAGPELAAAIRGGQLSLGELTSQITNGHDTITGAAKDTETFSEKWTILKNNVLVGIAPLATAVFNGVGEAMDKLPAIANAVAKAFDEIKTAITGTNSGAGQLQGVMATVSQSIRTFVDIAKTLWGAFGDNIISVLRAVATNVGTQIRAIVAILQGVLDFIDGVFHGNWGQAWNGIKEIFGGFVTGIKGEITLLWTYIQNAFSIGLTVLSAAWGVAWNLIKSVLGTILTGIESLLSAAWSAIKSTADAAWGLIKTAITAPFQAASAALSVTATGIHMALSASWSAIKTAADTAWNAIKSAITTPLTEAKKLVSGIISDLSGVLRDGWSRMLSGVSGFASDVAGKITGAFKGAANLVIGFLNAIIKAINLIPGVPNIHTIGALATGGTIGGSAGSVLAGLPRAAQGMRLGAMPSGPGGRVTRPMAIVGEEAPKHAEYVIPTNPAYRARALGLYAQMSKELGIPGFSLGGIVSGIGSTISGAAGAVGSAVSSVAGIPAALLSQGVSWILNQLPGVGSLPDWLKGTGKTVLDDVTKWIKDHVTSLLSSITGIGGSGGGPSGGGSAVNEALGHQMMLAAGWGEDQWPSLLNLWIGESGWSSTVMNNPSMGWLANGNASGIPQADGHGQVYASGDARGQIAWGLNYIRSVYGSPSNAYAQWLSRSPHWYAEGGMFGGLTPAPFVGSYKDGGIVPRDGLAYVHQGEAITPAGGGTERFQFFLDGKEIDVRVVKITDQRDRDRTARFRAGLAP